jgi:predicted CoA-substrate-specific enzyme activase
MKRFGIDVGSLFIGTALLQDNKIISTSYKAHEGDIRAALSEVINSEQARGCGAIGITGNFFAASRSIIDNSLCVIEGARHIAPASRNVFSIGAEHFMLCLYDKKGVYKEHVTNPPCASGTGSFIEQQARRLKLSVQELACRAEAYQGKIPHIATRCAVFAKSDIIHAMQEGYTLDAVCAGLCQGIARTIISSLLKGRKLTEPISVVGGVSLNKKIMQALGQLLGKQVTVPDHAPVAGAVGAALLAENRLLGVEEILQDETHGKHLRNALSLSRSSCPDFSHHNYREENGIEIIPPQDPAKTNHRLYLGIDIGSTSTKAVLINEHKEIISGFYTYTQGDPIGAVRLLLQNIKKVLDGQNFKLCAAATTGSGRKMIKELFAADMEINEITAHAKAAATLYPEVDTIIEIGGQDSKFTLLKSGDVYYSHMNYVCAAGTGSFIEEQAKLLGVDLNDFSDLALGARAPYTSDRCTVYMERDLGELKSRGFSKEALAAAVLFSVRDNYLAKVVNRSPLGEHIVFQGATARNKALVAAFEQYVKKPIHVSPYCHLTGAMGAAIICAEKGLDSSGFLLETSEFSVHEEVCSLCANHCLLTVAQSNGRTAAWGMKCGREYTASKRKAKDHTDGPHKRFITHFSTAKTKSGHSQTQNHTIHLLDTLYHVEYNPLWENFLERLGFKVAVCRPSAHTLNSGKKLVNSDFCAPIINAHGLLHQALEQGARFIFLPALISEDQKIVTCELPFREKICDSYFCYYSQYLPTLLANLTSVNIKDKLISPLLTLRGGDQEEVVGTLCGSLTRFFPDLSQDRIREAFTAAYSGFYSARNKLSQVFKAHDKAAPDDKLRIVLLGRPYVLFDSSINLGIYEKLVEQGAEVYSMFEVDADENDLSYAAGYYERMHWNYGQTILKVAERIAKSPDSFVVFLSCFRCSPDSFLLSYVKDIMTHYAKPFLLLQLDEHALDVGYSTRIEAALESFRNYMRKNIPSAKNGSAQEASAPVKAASEQEPQSTQPLFNKGDIVLIPYLNRLISRFWADCFMNAGFEAMILSSTEKDLLTGYRYANGGECMPAVAIVGGVIEKVRRENLDPTRTALYLPTLCMACNFPQFPVLADMVFDEAGLAGLKVARINSMQQGDILPGNLPIKIFEAGVLASLVYKLYFRIKPYELEKGGSEQALHAAEKLLSRAFKKGLDTRKAFHEVCGIFSDIKWDKKCKRKPRLGILGDFYVKYNEVVNQNLQGLIEKLDAELVIPSFTEMTFHFFDVDAGVNKDSLRRMKILRIFEQRYENMAEEILAQEGEPDWHECVQLMEDYGLLHYLPGETSINCGRALYSITHKRVDGIVHVNPMFCCPGVVSSSIFRKMQQDFGVPIVDLFYDGMGQPNKILIPHVHYLKRQRG